MGVIKGLTQPTGTQDFFLVLDLLISSTSIRTRYSNVDGKGGERPDRFVLRYYRQASDYFHHLDARTLCGWKSVKTLRRLPRPASRIRIKASAQQFKKSIE